MIYIFLADGFEECEALIPIDVLRRAGKKVTTVSIHDRKEVVGAHGVTVVADTLFAENEYGEAELMVLPGGMPGASNLVAHEGLCTALLEQHRKCGLIAAICASPAVVLSQLGILKGCLATCYPGFEEMMIKNGADCTGELVERDGHIVTGEGPAAAFPFAFELAAIVADPETAGSVASDMRYLHLLEQE